MALTKTTPGAVNQILCMDGTTAVKDAIHNLAFTKTGGVGNTWPGDSSNFRTLLGSRAPVIAQTNDNLLSDENASFEGNTVGTWGMPTKCVIAADATQYWHGTHSLKMTNDADGRPDCNNSATAITSAGTQYTASCRFKGVVGKSYYMVLYDNVGSTSGVAIVADGTWQALTVSRTFDAGSTIRRLYLSGPAAGGRTGDIVYWDAIQLETGAVATPFALDYRTGGYCRIATPFSVAPLSLFFVVNEPWAGNDGVLHTLYDDDAISIYKTAANALTFEVTDAAAGVKTMAGAVTAVNMAANTNHFIAATLTGGVLTLKLNNTALTTSGGAGTGIPGNFNANAFLGTNTAGENSWNGALLGALWGKALSVAEQTALASAATWASVIDLPQITVTGLATGNAVRLYDSAGNIHASAVETGGTATLTYTLD